MLVSVQRVTNFLILSQIVCLVLLWNLFLVMYGVMQEILLEEKNIMLVLFMTLASSPGYICSSLNLKFFPSSKNFRNLLSVSLTERLLQSKVTGEEST